MANSGGALSPRSSLSIELWPVGRGGVGARVVHV